MSYETLVTEEVIDRQPRVTLFIIRILLTRIDDPEVRIERLETRPR